jgi:hypothetical protein
VVVFVIKDLGANTVSRLLLLLPIIMAGIFVSLWWRQLIIKYKGLVGLRINVLRKMEENKDLAGTEKMYHAEAEGKIISRIV